MSLSAFVISEELKKDANAVVREHYTEVTIESIDVMYVKTKRIITVLNKLGNNEVDTYAYYDNDTKITQLSAKIYDSFGEEIKKFSKSKFQDVSAVSGGTLYSDNRVKYIDYTPTKYPYTVVFESKYKTSSTGFIPTWYPVQSFNVSVEKSEYKVINPNNFEIKTKENNFKKYPIKKVSDTNIHYTAEKLSAIENERNSLSFVDLMPELLVALNNFTLKKVPGTATNWKEFGKWTYSKLLKEKTTLSPATINKVQELTKDANNDIEKAKIIYKYMQDKTRYISVQVGIGGWEPIPANEVDKLGYGDCKGLTNYTKALLNAVGVEANYTIVYANNRRDINKDFTSIQGNHAILNIPNNGKDVWLECTSQKMPFGFLGDFTDDRNVLVVTPEGGVIKRTPAYKNEDNLQTTKANIELLDNGNLKANVHIISEGIQYDQKFTIDSKSQEDLKKYYKSTVWDYNNNLTINSIKLNNNKENIVFDEKIDLDIREYASINENELLFRLNVFNKNSFIPKRYRTRNLPLKINRGYKDVDIYTFTIPENYTFQQLPEKKVLETKFGNYTLEIEKIDDRTITYKKEIIIKDGIYPKEDYKLYRKFRKSIAKLENSRIALLKK
ncbi:DUF3857 domain-containing protein [Tenacibaculum sp. M341]|nr:DUF3857 domain-containing protein [Tenacibaculum sp. M341]